MSLIERILSWFRHPSKGSNEQSHTRHLEAKYWPEVMDYMQRMTEIVKSNTIDDENVHQVNERILDYILDQINKKGSIDDPKQRYLALETLADRILVVELGKIAGLKQNEGTRAEFSEATNAFKKRLAARHENEMRSN